jgi:predicted GNAT family acetyltransferase
MINLDEAANRFTYTSDAASASLQFRQRADRLVIIHTVVPPELEGKGVGSRLVTAAVEYASIRGLTVVPVCPFARAWLRSHPDVAATVNIEWPSDAGVD